MTRLHIRILLELCLATSHTNLILPTISKITKRTQLYHAYWRHHVPEWQRHTVYEVEEPVIGTESKCNL